MVKFTQVLVTYVKHLAPGTPTTPQSTALALCNAAVRLAITIQNEILSKGAFSSFFKYVSKGFFLCFHLNKLLFFVEEQVHKNENAPRQMISPHLTTLFKNQI